LYNRKTINAYRECHPKADGALRAWVALIEGRSFRHFPELKTVFGSADLIAGDRVVFDVMGNRYRLVAAVDFERQAVFVKWFGTHRQYDKIDPAEVEYGYPPC